jgi:hypothetical protein
LSNNNVFYVNATGSTVGVGSFGTTNAATLADWQAVNGAAYDQQSVYADPVFAGGDNYTPTIPAVNNTGVGVGVTTDINGTTRSATTPDAGAYEWSAPLPVTLLSFTGTESDHYNQLAWITANEINNAGFELQRSIDGATFTKLAFIATKAAAGNSTALLGYSYQDVKPFAGNNYYRLKQVDRNGNGVYSSIVLLVRNVATYTINKIYPNPAASRLNVSIASPYAVTIEMIVTDITGKPLLRFSRSMPAGTTIQNIDVSGLAAGTYILNATSATKANVQLFKFIKQ